jgi:hypothetical protein
MLTLPTRVERVAACIERLLKEQSIAPPQDY